MKTIVRAVLATVTIIGLTLAVGACKGGDGKEGGEGSAAVEVSAEMKTFVSELKGKSSDVEAALKNHGAEGLDSAGMDMYDLQSPKVVKAEGDCYTLEAKAGITTRTYVVCWKDGKIASVEDKGMK